MRTSLLALAILHISFAANSQEICTGILKYTGNDYYRSSTENAIAADIFNQHCSGEQAKASSASSLGLDVIVKSIPIKFNYGGSNSSERLNNFCKTYSSNSTKFSSEEINKSTVVRSALSAFNSCLSLASKGIYISPTIGLTTIIVDIRRGPEDSAISGVGYDNQLLECRLPARNEATGAKVANKNSYVKLNGDFVTITCDRKPIDGPGGEKHYPSAELTISTTEGGMLLTIPSDTALSPTKASEIEEKTAELKKSIDDVRQSIPRLKPLQLYKCPKDLEHKGGLWATWGCTGQISSQSQCFNYTHVGQGDSSSWYVYKACEPLTVLVPQ